MHNAKTIAFLRRELRINESPILLFHERIDRGRRVSHGVTIGRTRAKNLEVLPRSDEHACFSALLQTIR